jgi:hypothetical protein
VGEKIYVSAEREVSDIFRWYRQSLPNITNIKCCQFPFSFDCLIIMNKTIYCMHLQQEHHLFLIHMFEFSEHSFRFLQVSFTGNWHFPSSTFTQLIPFQSQDFTRGKTLFIDHNIKKPTCNRSYSRGLNSLESKSIKFTKIWFNSFQFTFATFTMVRTHERRSR